MLALVPLFVGCAPSARSDDTGALPEPYYVDDPAPITPAITPDGASAAIDALLARAYRYDANVALVAYDEVMAFADATCPAITVSPDGGSLWDDNCTASTGARFDGIVSGYVDEVPNYGRQIRGEATIGLPDGTALVLAGGASTIGVTDTSWTSSLDGLMRYDGPAAAGTWLEDGVDLNYAFSIAGGPDDIVTSTLDGSAGDLDGEVTAIAFSGFEASADPAWPCPGEPGGGLAVRDVAGVWVDVVFDVTGSAEDGWAVRTDGVCDGCGELWHGGNDLGQVCIDVSPLLDATPPAW